MAVSIIQGDCLEVLPTLEAGSFHACVTDPPYHLTSIVKRFGSSTAAPAKSNGAIGVYARASAGFMGKVWDGGDVAFRPETWAAVHRVLKPGGHLLAFGGTRTFHRLACAIEDAGFEIRDTIMWIYASGFPKSLDVSKQLDRAAGAEREVVGAHPYAARKPNGTWTGDVYGDEPNHASGPQSTAPSTEAARAWQGWGTALKPAVEMVCVARKPLSEGTVAANVLRHGTGAINVDASRVGVSREVPASLSRCKAPNEIYGDYGGGQERELDPNIGRWPANVVHDGSPEVMDAFARFGERRSAGDYPSDSVRTGNGSTSFQPQQGQLYDDGGTGARFFFCAKADASERVGSHPTVKPVALMEWLVRLVTPPGGRVLDPFCGTGSTLVACDRLGFDAVGIEQDAQTVADAHEKFRRMRARRMIGDAPAPSVADQRQGILL